MVASGEGGGLWGREGRRSVLFVLRRSSWEAVARLMRWRDTQGATCREIAQKQTPAVGASHASAPTRRRGEQFCHHMHLKHVQKSLNVNILRRQSLFASLIELSPIERLSHLPGH